jgi:hypothetical protein
VVDETESKQEAAFDQAAGETGIQGSPPTAPSTDGVVPLSSSSPASLKISPVT